MDRLFHTHSSWNNKLYSSGKIPYGPKSCFNLLYLSKTFVTLIANLSKPSMPIVPVSVFNHKNTYIPLTTSAVPPLPNHCNPMLWAGLQKRKTDRKTSSEHVRSIIIADIAFWDTLGVFLALRHSTRRSEQKRELTVHSRPEVQQRRSLLE